MSIKATITALASQQAAALRGLLERAGLGGAGLPAKLAQMEAFGVTRPEVRQRATQRRSSWTYLLVYSVGFCQRYQ